MKTPTLSVVMSNFNHAKYIGEALESILSQSYRPLEIIVIDDASTDNSVEVIQDFVNRNPIVRLIRNEKNMGLIYNTNKFFQLARGDYIYDPGADDHILPGFFKKSMDLLARYPQAALCSTLSLIIDEQGLNKGLFLTPIISSKETFLDPEKALFTLRKYGNWILGNATISHRKILLDAGGYRDELHSYADGFVLQVNALKYGACFIPEPLVTWRKTGRNYSISSNNNLEMRLDIINNATGLKRSIYSNLFPSDYVRTWEKENLFKWNLSRLSLSQKERLDNLIHLLQPLNLSDKVLLFIMRICQYFEYICVKICLYARLKNSIKRFIINRLNYIWYCFSQKPGRISIK